MTDHAQHPECLDATRFVSVAEYLKWVRDRDEQVRKTPFFSSIMTDHAQHSFTPAQAAAGMQERYGSEAPVHATYNLMLHDKGTPGYLHWLAVREKLTFREFETPYSRALAFAERDANRCSVRELFKLYGGGSVVEQVSGMIDAAEETGMDLYNEAIY
jgi:hypothetical protein